MNQAAIYNKKHQVLGLKLFFKLYSRYFLNVEGKIDSKSNYQVMG
jgi:hypothetical protein